MQCVRNAVDVFVKAKTEPRWKWNVRSAENLLPLSSKKMIYISAKSRYLIGHVNEGLDDVSLATLEQWHKDALELKEISLIIERRLEEIKN